jgi:membrane-associated phospholipid phosphatase
LDDDAGYATLHVKPASDSLSSADPVETRGALLRFTNLLLGGYLLLVLGLMFVLRVNPSIDLFAVLVGMAAVLMGRGKAFVRDWGPFVLIFLAWEAMRGVANTFGQTVQSDSIIAVERALFFGIVPPVELQAALHQPGRVNGLDIGLSLVYISHFFFPLAMAFVFWLRERILYYRFVATLMFTSFAAFLTFLAMPVAPPRFAFQFGEALPIVDIVAAVSAQISWEGFSWMYGNLVGNPVAAFPSMHAAYPTLVLLFLFERWRKTALLWVPVTVTIWFATVYLGHHYVIDVLGGVVYAVGAYLIFRDERVIRFILGRKTGAGSDPAS